MARNNIPTNLSILLSTAGKAADGAHLHETALGLQYNIETRIRADRQALLGATTAYDAAKAARSQQNGRRADQSDQARVHIQQIVDALRPRLGREWTPAWEAAGFSGGSLTVPKAQLARLGLVARLETYFTQNPTHEIAGMGATAAACAAAHTAFAAACAAADQAEAGAAATRLLRDTAAEVLARRLHNLVEELHQVMGEDDSRWHAFGFNAPADPEAPEAPEPAAVRPGAAGSQTLLVDWVHAMRAERYRLLVRLPGQDDALVSGTFEDKQATVSLQGLAPSGVAVEVLLSGINEAGASPYSEAIQVTVP